MKKTTEKSKINTVGLGTWENDTLFIQWLTNKKIAVKSFQRYQEKTKENWFGKYHDEQWAALPKEPEKPVEEPTEKPEKPADEKPAEKPKKEKKAKTPRVTTKDKAVEFLKDIDESLYHVDKKGRYIFEGFYLIFKRDEITLAPSKMFRLEHNEINWDYHEGWANPYRTAVSKEFVLSAIENLMMEEEEEEDDAE